VTRRVTNPAGVEGDRGGLLRREPWIQPAFLKRVETSEQEACRAPGSYSVQTDKGAGVERIDATAVSLVGTDVLVLGSGGAGIRAAIEARRNGADVLVLSTSRAGKANNTAISGGIIAIALGLDGQPDTPAVHFADTVESGRGIGDPRLVGTMTEGATPEFEALQTMGVKFRSEGGRYHVAKMPGHTHARTLSFDPRGGGGLLSPLRTFAERIGIKFVENVLALDLFTVGDSAVGVFAASDGGEWVAFHAPAAVLATGGAGQVFARNNNVVEATGDGMAMAFRLGARLRDMEFVQYYPTGPADHVESRSFISYEVFANVNGAAIRNANGEDILEKYHLKESSKMTRDRLSQAIMREIREGRGMNDVVHIDLSKVAGANLTLPLEKAGSTPAMIPIAPITHYTMGGIVTNGFAESDIPGLYAVGEVAGGVHGANRLASNSLVDVCVFGRLAGQAAAVRAASMKARAIIAPSALHTPVARVNARMASRGKASVGTIRQRLQRLMWDDVGVIRSQATMERALTSIRALDGELAHAAVHSYGELRDATKTSNMLLVADLMTRSALHRMESRGAHYRSDVPDEEPRWQTCTVASNRDGAPAVTSESVSVGRRR
jgi:fumarate reductase (CoM/CoB) subunit A